VGLTPPARNTELSMSNEPVLAPSQPPRMMPFAIYIAYLASFLTGISLLVGVVLAYVQRGSGPAWLETHFRYQIRTFWIFLVYAILSGVLCLILIGFFLLFLTSVWFIIRCVKGMTLLDRGEAVPNPTTWWW
jgi:uncharacterized membrane protein